MGPPVGSVPGSPPPATPGHRHRGRVLAFVAVLLVVALLAGGAGVVAIHSRRGDSTATPPSTTAAPGAPRPSAPSATTPGATDPTGATDPADPSGSSSGNTAAATDLRDAVAKIKTFVEKDRGLTFDRDVDIVVASGTEFEAQVRAQVDGDKDAMVQQGELLEAAGLIPASYDMVAGQLDLLAAGVLGFYDPKTKKLVVRGGSKITPFVREVLAHELTHALDDQRFGLDRPDLQGVTDGRDFAFLALVEGSAKRVENDYVATFDAAEKQTLQQEMLQMGMDQMQTITNVPMVLPRLQMAPYDYGEPFVRALVQHGGTAALDAAMRSLPTTSEQILDPDKYAAGEGAVAVDRPPIDGTAVEDGTLGQLMTGFLLHGKDSDLLGGLGGLLGGDTGGGGGDGGGEAGTGGLDGLDPDLLAQLLDLLLGGHDGAGGADNSGGTDPSGTDPGGLGDLSSTGFPPIETVKGWGGDHYVVYRTGSTTCLRVDWRMDTPAALGALDTALHAWANGDQAVKIEMPDTGMLRATRCS